MDRRDHWNRVYQTKTPESVSWYQQRPDLSLELIAASCVGKDAGIIDVGGGTSVLIDHLLKVGYTNLRCWIFPVRHRTPAVPGSAPGLLRSSGSRPTWPPSNRRIATFAPGKAEQLFNYFRFSGKCGRADRRGV
jgi:hypothetical protein